MQMRDVAVIRIAIVMMMLVMVMIITVHGTRPRQWRKRSLRLPASGNPLSSPHCICIEYLSPEICRSASKGFSALGLDLVMIRVMRRTRSDVGSRPARRVYTATAMAHR